MGSVQVHQPDDYIHNYPEILDLKVNAKSGIYDIVALTNWRSEKVTRKLAFADKSGLNLDANSEDVVLDYWHQQVLGVFKGGIELEICPARDARAADSRAVGAPAATGRNIPPH